MGLMGGIERLARLVYCGRNMVLVVVPYRTHGLLPLFL